MTILYVYSRTYASSVNNYVEYNYIYIYKSSSDSAIMNHDSLHVGTAPSGPLQLHICIQHTFLGVGQCTQLIQV